MCGIRIHIFPGHEVKSLVRPTLGLAAKLCCSLLLLAATAISGAQKSVKRFRNEPPKPAADWPHSGIALYVGGTIFSAAQISRLPLWRFCKVSEVPILMCSLSFPIEVLGLVADVYAVNLARFGGIFIIVRKHQHSKFEHTVCDKNWSSYPRVRSADVVVHLRLSHIEMRHIFSIKARSFLLFTVAHFGMLLSGRRSSGPRKTTLLIEYFYCA